MTNALVSVSVTPFNFNLDKIPEFPTDDSFVMVSDVNHFFFTAVDLFLVG